MSDTKPTALQTVDTYLLLIGTTPQPVPSTCNATELVSYALRKFGIRLHHNLTDDTLTRTCPYCGR
jgi:hypothetical protein